MAGWQAAERSSRCDERRRRRNRDGDPGFGHAGKASDFLLSKNPIAGFDYTKTNDTIRNAGRDHPVIMPPLVPATFPTYKYTSY